MESLTLMSPGGDRPGDLPNVRRASVAEIRLAIGTRMEDAERRSVAALDHYPTVKQTANALEASGCAHFTPNPQVRARPQSRP